MCSMFGGVSQAGECRTAARHLISGARLWREVKLSGEVTRA